LTDADIDPLGDDQLAAAIVLRSVRRLIRLSTPGPGLWGLAPILAQRIRPQFDHRYS